MGRPAGGAAGRAVGTALPTLRYTPEQMSVTRVVVADDQPMFRRGTLAALRAAGDVEVVADIENHDHAVEEVAALNPDVVVLGELSGGWDVFAATLRQHLPQTGLVVLLDHV